MEFSARFIPDFATAVNPLRKLAREVDPFMRREEQESTFRTLKRQVATAQVLIRMQVLELFSMPVRQ